MITATIEGNEIKTTGEIQEGDNYPDFCCVGFGWEVRVILVSVWGVCDNPDCPSQEDDDLYRGVSFVDPTDLAEWLAEKGQFETWCNANGYQDVTDAEPEAVNLDRLHQAIEAYDQATPDAPTVEASDGMPF